MAHYKGPCIVCGAPVDRNIKSHRPKRCAPCAIRHQAEHNYAVAMGTSPFKRTIEGNGARLAEEIAARSGPWYEAWRKGVLRAMGETSTTEGA